LALCPRNLNRSLKAALSFRGVEIVLLHQELAFEPMRLSLIAAVFMFISQRPAILVPEEPSTLPRLYERYGLR
jgi:hypothetical protein